MTGKIDTGRYLEFSVLSPSLKLGVILATFHDSGNLLVSMDVLNRKAREFIG